MNLLCHPFRLRPARTLALAAGAGLLLAACASEPSIPGEAKTTVTTTTTTTEAPLTLSKAREEFSPLQTPAPDVRLQNEAGVFLPGTTKAYAIGRYRDPGNRSILHEQHAAYRHEEDSSFLMHTGRENEVAIGNTADGGGRRYAMIRPARLKRSEVDAALTREQAEAARLRVEADRLKASSAALQTAATGFNQSVQTNAGAVAQVGTLQTEVGELSRKVTALQQAAAQATPPPLPPDPAPTPTPTAPTGKVKGKAGQGASTPSSGEPTLDSDGKIRR